MVTLLAFGGALAVLAFLVVLIFRRLGRSQKLVRTIRVDAVRAQARATAATESADRITGVAEQAVQQISDALEIARLIETVDGKVDALLGYVTVDADKLDNGKHRRNLRVINDEANERYIA